MRFGDLPQNEGPAGRFMLRQMLAVAELEGGPISERTKTELDAAKARGRKLAGDRGNLQGVGDKGRAVSLAVRQDRANRRKADLSPIIAEIQTSGATSLPAIAAELTRGIPTARGGRWSASSYEGCRKRRNGGRRTTKGRWLDDAVLYPRCATSDPITSRGCTPTVMRISCVFALCALLADKTL